MAPIIVRDTNDHIPCVLPALDIASGQHVMSSELCMTGKVTYVYQVCLETGVLVSLYALQ